MAMASSFGQVAAHARRPKLGRGSPPSSRTSRPLSSRSIPAVSVATSTGMAAHLLPQSGGDLAGEG